MKKAGKKRLNNTLDKVTHLVAPHYFALSLNVRKKRLKMVRDYFTARGGSA